jgi:YggT family protein
MLHLLALHLREEMIMTHEVHTHSEPDRVEAVHERSDGLHHRRERVVVDNAAERRQVAYLFSQLIWLAFGIVEGLILVRVVLRLIAANPGAPFANFIYRVTDIFLWPFYGLTTEPALGGMVLEISSLIGLIVYALLAWVLVKLVWLLFYRTSTNVVQTYEHDYDDDIH